MSDYLRASGAWRDPENDRVLSISFNRSPTDDEMRAVQDFLHRPPATCPFCAAPTYGLPCTSCGEPDIPDF